MSIARKGMMSGAGGYRIPDPATALFIGAYTSDIITAWEIDANGSIESVPAFTTGHNGAQSAVFTPNTFGQGNAWTIGTVFWSVWNENSVRWETVYADGGGVGFDSNGTQYEDTTNDTYRDVEGIAVDPENGYLYLANMGQDTIFKIDISNFASWNDVASYHAESDLGINDYNDPGHICLDQKGQRAFVACRNTGAVLMLDVSGSGIALLDNDLSPTGAFMGVYDEDANVYYLADRAGATIRVFDVSANTFNQINTFSTTRTQNCRWMFLDRSTRRLYAQGDNSNGDQFVHAIDVTDPTATLTASQLEITNWLGGADDCAGMTLDVANANLYLSYLSADSILSIDVSDPTNMSYTGRVVTSTYLNAPWGGIGIDIPGTEWNNAA